MGSGIRRESPTTATKRGKAAGIRTGLGAEAIAAALIDNLHCLQGKSPRYATRNDWYMALAYTVRDRMLDRYVTTLEAMATPAAPARWSRISRRSS